MDYFVNNIIIDIGTIRVEHSSWNEQGERDGGSEALYMLYSYKVFHSYFFCFALYFGEAGNSRQRILDFASDFTVIHLYIILIYMRPLTP